jgi:eukaryotic-like serine/threonine-protein kinase
MRKRNPRRQEKPLRRLKFRFGRGFELDPGEYELRLAGEPVRLRPIPFELLHLLIRRQGQLVSRDQIVSIVWGERVAIDAHRNINETIKHIRKVLRDDVNDSRFIKTVFTKGYRFVAPVKVVNVDGARAFS